MNTKSIVAAVKKPKATPKVAKAAKAAKAVVKKPKATPKVAKAVVKKPKVPKAAPKVAKAVVKKPKRGGAGNGFLRSMFGFKKTSNAVVPTFSSLTPVVEEPQKAPIEKCMRPSHSILLNKILNDYETIFVDKIIANKFTVYDLLDLVEKIANNLNKFFEDFLHFYPIVIFKLNETDKKIYYDYDNKFLKIQDRFVKINSKIRSYIDVLGTMYYENPIFWRTSFTSISYVPLKEHYTTQRNYGKYLDTSKIVYNGILDGTQKGIKEYKRDMLNFFKFYYILKLKDYDMPINSPLVLFKNYQLYFGDTIYGKELSDYTEFNTIVKELYEILRDFFSYISFMEINKNKGEIDTELKRVCEKYIEDAKNAASTNLDALKRLYGTLSPKMGTYINRREHTPYRSGIVIRD